MRGISKNPVPACGTGLLPRRSTVPALGSSRNLPDSDLLDLPDQSDCLNGEVETHGTSTLNKCQTPPRHARRGFRGRLGLVRLAVQVAVRVGTRIAGAEVRDGVGSAARVLVLAENPRAVRRTVNPNRDRDEPEMLAMLEVLKVQEVQEVQAMLDCHGSRTGTLFASSPGLTLFRPSALPVKGLKLVVEKRRRCGALSPESALAILQKTPPDAL